MRREYLKPAFIFLLILISLASHAQETDKKYLSGWDKDNTIDWEFKVSGGRNSGEWKTIPVPSNWEMQGFGTYRYWSDWAEEPAPDSVGNYRYQFEVPAEWKGKAVDIVFGGAMTDTKVKINGRSAGPVHQGGFYEFRYDVSSLLNFGKPNLLEVEVHRFSSDSSVNLAERRADFWLFSGIYRPVWLEAFPKSHIVRMAINARHDGDFAVNVFVEGINASGYTLEGQVFELSGKPVGTPFSETIKRKQKEAVLKTKAADIKPWSAEWPNLYRVEIKLLKNGDVVHRTSEKFGFRTIEVREGDGVYVNGAKIRLRGTNRHSFWPTSGRTTSRELSVIDANLIKEMNMNAVRMSHYPPDKHFLEVTDSLGLYVLDELTGWQDEYNTEVGTKLVRELVVRDVNHPSIIFWDNGNEGGWNYDLDGEFAKWDPQNRTVLHPWETFGGINTTHYEVYNCCTGTFFQGNELFMPTEFLHGLYDGGNGAGLEDWWNLMVKNPLAVGGFLWAFADEGIVRDDREGEIDVAGNSAPDGIVGPYREKEGSFYTVREVWSPVYLEMSDLNVLPGTFNGKMKIENRFDHTNLSQVKFSWELVDFPLPMSGKGGHKVVKSGNLPSPDVKPHETGMLAIDLPESWTENDALYLTATDPHGREIYTWSWMISKVEEMAGQIENKIEGKAAGKEEGGFILLEANGTKVSIDAATGLLYSVEKNGSKVPLTQGPKLLSGETEFKDITHQADGDDYVVKTSYEGSLHYVKWRMLADGTLRLTYSYHINGHDQQEYMGITFTYPEDHVTGMRWLGKGPYRVWKNRLKGVEFDVWEKPYNDAVTGLVWEYPEFKGFHGDVYWATLETKDLPVTVVFENQDMYLKVFTPKEAEGEGFDPRTTHVNFPQGDISFLRGIAPIGTKFHTAAEHGPAGQLNSVQRHGKTFEDTVLFIFGAE